jgi:poly-D-alanine transfer protein DltD
MQLKINKKTYKKIKDKKSKIKNQKNEDQYSNIPFQGDCLKILNDIHELRDQRE